MSTSAHKPQDREPVTTSIAHLKHGVVEARSGHVASGSEYRAKSKPSILARMLPISSSRCQDIRRLAYELLSETRSFLSRIRLLLATHGVVVVDLGPHLGQDSGGHLVECTRTRGRRQDIHKFRSKTAGYRSTQIDLQIYVAGWTAGAKWADDTRHICTLGKGDPELPCMNLDLGLIK